MKHSPTIRKLRQILEENGMELQNTNGGHLGIYKDRKRLWSCPSTPSEPHAYENTIRDLVKLGHLDKKYKQVKLRS